MSDSLWPLDCTFQVPLSIGFPRQKYLSGLIFPTLEDLPNPCIKTVSSASPALQVDSLPLCYLGSPFLFSRSGQRYWISNMETGDGPGTETVLLISSVQLLSHVWLFVTPWTAARQASLSITKSQRLLKLMFIELVLPSNCLILCRPLLILPSIFPSIRILSNESVLPIRWAKYWSFSFSISPSSEYSGLISLQSKGLLRVFSNTTVQRHQFFGAQLSL